jgi:hypothetical protein
VLDPPSGAGWYALDISTSISGQRCETIRAATGVPVGEPNSNMAAACRAAKRSCPRLGESQQVLELTQSFYQAGCTDLDNVRRPQMDRDKAMTGVRTLVFTRWQRLKITL